MKGIPIEVLGRSTSGRNNSSICLIWRFTGSVTHPAMLIAHPDISGLIHFTSHVSRHREVFELIQLTFNSKSQFSPKRLKNTSLTHRLKSILKRSRRHEVRVYLRCTQNVLKVHNTSMEGSWVFRRVGLQRQINVTRTKHSDAMTRAGSAQLISDHTACKSSCQF